MSDSTSIPYPYLPEGREIRLVSGDNEFMQAAREMGVKASDQQHPTGAVVVKDGKVIGKGANFTIAGVIPFLIKTHSKWCIRRLFKVPSGQKYWMCPGCTASKDHAESRAVRDAKKNGHDPKGADIYLWGHWWCCTGCWDAMIKGGIKDVYVEEGAYERFSR